ncbi:hypothetical protein NECAME_00043 [Necator americanus]|uniref:Uncharacterized protein n=1 Tax=Necator americanus TaxID=51031 RepID=W2TZS6_NECAM|nr:hypothetical protein NECAME_00043 [Necator americanus]ETN87184.1 hypothetical protein NECAME_00043 [Necator americanus]
MLGKLRRRLHHRDEKIRRQTICEGVNHCTETTTAHPATFETIIDRRHSPEGRWKGVVFGQKGNSRSGHFQSSTVKIIEKPETVISMSSRVAVAPFQGSAPPSGRQAKKVNVPVVPNMSVVDRSKYEDVNRNVRSNLSCRSVASPSRMSDDRSSDTQNCNRISRPTIFGTNSSSSFSSYGTEVGHLLGTKSGGELCFKNKSSFSGVNGLSRFLKKNINESFSDNILSILSRVGNIGEA